MNVLWFLKRRTAFVREFYKRTSQSFIETKVKIEGGEPPFAPTDEEHEEPPFLEEWQREDQALEFLGQACVSYLAAAVKLYLTESEHQFRGLWGQLFPFPAVDHEKMRTDGIVPAYEEWFAEFGIEFRESGADVELLREIVTTRNLAQHPKSIGLMHLSQRESDRKRFPRPFFAHPVEQMIFSSESDHEIPWMLSITPDAFFLAVDEVEKLCEWLERQWRDGPKALPSSLRPPGDLVGEVINYFRKPQVAGVRLVADVSVGQRVRIVNQGDVDFEQQIVSMQLDGASVQAATSGSEIGLKIDQRAPEGAKIYRLREN
jgi:hypothetical protein